MKALCFPQEKALAATALARQAQGLHTSQCLIFKRDLPQKVLSLVFFEWLASFRHVDAAHAGPFRWEERVEVSAKLSLEP
jgi:hypothetical protein